MSIENVLQHYGFKQNPDPVMAHAFYSEFIHPTAQDLNGRACLVMVLGNRAVVHCQYGSPIYSVSPEDVEFLLRREYECFSCLPFTGQA